MKRLSMLVPLVTAGLLASGLTTTGSATAGIAPGAGGHRALAQVINLHKAYEARLLYAARSRSAGINYPKRMGPIAPGRGGTGVTYPKGMSPFPGQGINGCPEPYCPVSYQSGPVQLNPHVYLLLWGPDWSTDPESATASYLESFYSGLGVEPDDNWSTIISQYGDASGNPKFNGSVYEGAWQDMNAPPTGVDQAEIAAEADSFAASQKIRDLADAQIVVATQQGTCPQYFYAPSVCGDDGGYYCAWHNYSNVAYINLPYLLDAGTACGEDAVNSDGTYDGFSMVGGDQFAETVTDPHLESGWWDGDDKSGGEIGDKCAWSPNSSDVALSTGTFAMQPLWSNSTDNTNGACVMPTGGGSDQVAVASPGNQSTYQGSKLSLDISGTSSGNYPLTWSATGLPSGLTISPSGTPGVISGEISADPGTYTVTVTASDSTGSSALTSFDWTVEADVGADIVNQAAGLCLNDYGSEIAPGTEVVMYTCHATGPADMFSYPSNGELVVLGQCLTDHGYGGTGALQLVEPCTGASDQVWSYNSKDEYVVQSNQLCLTDPGGSTLKEERTVVEKCTGTKAQRWTGS
jgi:hypothetical protein